MNSKDRYELFTYTVKEILSNDRVFIGGSERVKNVVKTLTTRKFKGTVTQKVSKPSAVVTALTPLMPLPLITFISDVSVLIPAFIAAVILTKRLEWHERYNKLDGKGKKMDIDLVDSVAMLDHQYYVPYYNGQLHYPQYSLSVNILHIDDPSIDSEHRLMKPDSLTDSSIVYFSAIAIDEFLHILEMIAWYSVDTDVSYEYFSYSMFKETEAYKRAVGSTVLTDDEIIDLSIELIKAVHEVMYKNYINETSFI